MDDLKWQQRRITASLPTLFTSSNSTNQRIQKRQHLLLEPGPSGWWGAYSSVDALFSQLSILSPHLSEDYFPLCPSPISHFSLAIQKELIRPLVLHPGLSQHHSPLPPFPIFGLLSIWSAFQLKQLKKYSSLPSHLQNIHGIPCSDTLFQTLFFNIQSFFITPVSLFPWANTDTPTTVLSFNTPLFSKALTYMFTVSHLLQVHCGILPHTSSCRCCLVWV